MAEATCLHGLDSEGGNIPLQGTAGLGKLTSVGVLQCGGRGFRLAALEDMEHTAYLSIVFLDPTSPALIPQTIPYPRLPSLSSCNNSLSLPASPLALLPPTSPILSPLRGPLLTHPPRAHPPCIDVKIDVDGHLPCADHVIPEIYVREVGPVCKGALRENYFVLWRTP